MTSLTTKDKDNDVYRRFSLSYDSVVFILRSFWQLWLLLTDTFLLVYIYIYIYIYIHKRKQKKIKKMRKITNVLLKNLLRDIK